MNLTQALELERLKCAEAVGRRTRAFQQMAEEINSRIDRRSGAWHAARGKLKFERIVAGIEDSLRIREELIGKCAELGTPQQLRMLGQRIHSTIEAQSQQTLKSFEVEGIRPLTSVIGEGQSTMYGLKATVSRRLRMIELHDSGDPDRSAGPDACPPVQPIPAGEPPDHLVSHPPRVFMSYSWDNLDHKEWVRDLAARLRQEDGKRFAISC